MRDKAQFQLTGQFGSYLSAVEVTDNASISDVFDARKLHCTYGHGEYSEVDADALKAIKGEFQKVFQSDSYRIYDFLLQENQPLLAEWLGTTVPVNESLFRTQFEDDVDNLRQSIFEFISVE